MSTMGPHFPGMFWHFPSRVAGRLLGRRGPVRRQAWGWGMPWEGLLTSDCSCRAPKLGGVRPQSNYTFTLYYTGHMLLFAEGPIFVVEQTEASERQEPLTPVLLPPRSRAVPSWPPVISFPEASPVLRLFILPSPSPNVNLRSRETDADRTPVVVTAAPVYCTACPVPTACVIPTRVGVAVTVPFYR